VGIVSPIEIFAFVPYFALRVPGLVCQFPPLIYLFPGLSVAI
jgi:hypothetical protein